jgi:hypothetical protein
MTIAAETGLLPKLDASLGYVPGQLDAQTIECIEIGWKSAHLDDLALN